MENNPFIVDFPIKSCDFPQLCQITRGYLLFHCLPCVFSLFCPSKFRHLPGGSCCAACSKLLPPRWTSKYQTYAARSEPWSTGALRNPKKSYLDGFESMLIDWNPWRESTIFFDNEEIQLENQFHMSSVQSAMITPFQSTTWPFEPG